MKVSIHNFYETLPKVFSFQKPIDIEACIGVLGIQDIFPLYFQGYGILSIVLPGIWDTVFNILSTFRDIGHLGKLIMVIFASL